MGDSGKSNRDMTKWRVRDDHKKPNGHEAATPLRDLTALIAQHMQQQTGVPPIIMQHVAPDFMHAIRQSQQP